MKLWPNEVLHRFSELGEHGISTVLLQDARGFAAVSQIPDFPDAGVSPGLRGAPPAVVLRSLRTLGVVSCPLNLISLLGGGGSGAAHWPNFRVTRCDRRFYK